MQEHGGKRYGRLAQNRNRQQERLAATPWLAMRRGCGRGRAARGHGACHQRAEGLGAVDRRRAMSAVPLERGRAQERPAVLPRLPTAPRLGMSVQTARQRMGGMKAPGEGAVPAALSGVR